MLKASNLETIGIGRAFLERFRSKPELARRLVHKLAQAQLKIIDPEKTDSVETNEAFGVVSTARDSLDKSFEKELGLLISDNHTAFTSALHLECTPSYNYFNDKCSQLLSALLKIIKLQVNGSQLIETRSSSKTKQPVLISKSIFANFISDGSLITEKKSNSLDADIILGRCHNLYILKTGHKGVIEQELIKNLDKDTHDQVFVAVTAWIDGYDPSSFPRIDGYISYKPNPVKASSVKSDLISPEFIYPIELNRIFVARAEQLGLNLTEKTDRASLLDNISSRGFSYEELIKAEGDRNKLEDSDLRNPIVLGLGGINKDQVRIFPLGFLMLSKPELSSEDEDFELSMKRLGASSMAERLRDPNAIAKSNETFVDDYQNFWLAEYNRVSEFFRQVYSPDSEYNPLLPDTSGQNLGLLDIFLQSDKPDTIIKYSELIKFTFDQILRRDFYKNNQQMLDKVSECIEELILYSMRANPRKIEILIKLLYGSLAKNLENLVTSDKKIYLSLIDKINTSLMNKRLLTRELIFGIVELGLYTNALDPKIEDRAYSDKKLDVSSFTVKNFELMHYALTKDMPGIQSLVDEIGCVVDAKGKILFQNQNFEDGLAFELGTKTQELVRGFIYATASEKFIQELRTCLSKQFNGVLEGMLD